MSDANPNSSPVLLVVDDEASVLEVTAAFLATLGYQVETAHCAEVALEKLKALPEVPQALITDVVMPRISGVELAAQARDLYPELPILFFSAQTEGVISGGVRTAFLHKPFLHVRLAETLADLGAEPELERANPLNS